MFFREVVSAQRGNASAAERVALPCVLFLQGGPGFECGRPTEASGWLGELTKDHRVFLMDQRGTGKSNAEILRPTRSSEDELERPTLIVAGTDGFEAAEQWVHLLKCFRADSIVRDAELFRKTFLGENTKWTLLGQSFGGFCITTYLSFHPEGVKEALLTGGLPPLIDADAPAFEAYLRLMKRVKTQNEKFRKRFPADVKRIEYLHEHIRNASTSLPGGGQLTHTHVQALGFANLGTAQGMERLHYILEHVEPESTFEKPLTHKFLIEVENAFRHFETNPLYAILHESIYCNGANAYGAADKAYGRGDWAGSADESYPDIGYFTGEMVFDDFFNDIPSLVKYREIRGALLLHEHWPKLYDTNALSKNTVPVACASYVEDMFVDFDLAAETAAKINGARVWATSEYMHSGIREDGERIVRKLLSFVRDEDPIR